MHCCSMSSDDIHSKAKDTGGNDVWDTSRLRFISWNGNGIDHQPHILFIMFQIL